MKEDSNAFPLYLGVYNEPKPKHHHGMSLRAYIATTVLPTFASMMYGGDDSAVRSAEAAVMYADALIKRLEK